MRSKTRLLVGLSVGAIAWRLLGLPPDAIYLGGVLSYDSSHPAARVILLLIILSLAIDEGLFRYRIAKARQKSIDEQARAEVRIHKEHYLAGAADAARRAPYADRDQRADVETPEQSRGRWISENIWSIAGAMERKRQGQGKLAHREFIAMLPLALAYIGMIALLV